MAKFMAHLKQKEIEKIEQVTSEWKQKESYRESSFNEALTKVTQVENKLRQKTTDL